MNLFRCMLACGALALLPGASAVAQEQDEEQIIDCEKVPEMVMSTFAKTYPNATIKACAKEVENGKTAYEIAGVENNVARDVLYDADGVVIVVEETIVTTSLPGPVLQAAHKKFPKGEIILAEKLMRGSSVMYELQIKHQAETREIIFDPTGKEVEP